MSATYHVTRNGQFAADPYEDAVAGREAAIYWTADITDATIYSRTAALYWAEKFGGRAVLLTRGGTIRFVRSDRTRPVAIANAPMPKGGAR